MTILITLHVAYYIGYTELTLPHWREGLIQGRIARGLGFGGIGGMQLLLSCCMRRLEWQLDPSKPQPSDSPALNQSLPPVEGV